MVGSGTTLAIMLALERTESGENAPARRWLAVFWSAAMDDPTLDRWCRLVLLA